MTANCDFYNKKSYFHYQSAAILNLKGFSYLKKCKCMLVYIIDHNPAMIERYYAYKLLQTAIFMKKS